MADQKQIVVFSHGFGVRKDSRGLFTDIAAGLPGIEPVLFDYYESRDDGTVIVRPISEQAKLLGEIIEDTRRKYPGAVVDIIGHSQGCFAPALLRPECVRKVILLAPPYKVRIERMLERFRARPGAEINPGGVTTIPLTKGGVFLINPEYWPSLASLNPIERYNDLSRTSDLTLVIAKSDESIKSPDFTGLDPKAEKLEIEGDHNFTKKARAGLIKTIQDIVL